MNICRIMTNVGYTMSTEELTNLQTICRQKNNKEKYQEFKDETLEKILASGMNRQFLKNKIVRCVK